MSSAAEIEPPPPSPPAPPDRRGDVEARHERIARLLEEAGCEAVLLRDPANFRWLTAGSAPRGLAAPGEEPLLFATAQGRWVICGSADSQVLFDEELDGLGFQLKERPWYADADAFVAALSATRRVACDRPYRDWPQLGPALARERRRLSLYGQERYRELGQLLVHALEATARSLTRGDSEREVAGHLCHRLWRHGAVPHAVQVAADGRGRRHPRHGPTAAEVQRTCTLQATAEKYGLFATAARSVCFGLPDEALRRDWESAVRLNVACLSAARPDVPAGEVLVRAGRLVRGTPAEHDMRLAPLGYRTGHAPAEALLLPDDPEPLASGTPFVWQARSGDAAMCDTFLQGEAGWEAVTPTQEWPTRRAVSREERFERPDVLVLPPG